MHPVIWKDHDNSWTWSIEEGKAFEDDHRVLARDEGFATRGDAKEAMQKAWDRLLAEGKTPGRPRQLKPGSAPEPSDAKSECESADQHVAADKKVQLEWAVAVDDKIVAVFAGQSSAQKFGRAKHKGKYKLRRVKCTLSDSPDKT
jgi:hypothetical protein